MEGADSSAFNPAAPDEGAVLASLLAGLLAARRIQQADLDAAMDAYGRGAKAAAHKVKPDVAIVLEGPPADDTPGFPKSECQGALGGGVQIRLQDPSAIMNPRLVDFVCKVAEENGIQYQVTVRSSGGTDAGSFNIANEGIPSIVLGTPARYIHSHNAMINLHDYLEMVKLSKAVVKALDEKAVSALTEYL